jgi:methylated-DNA-[protein]-cysteine S-methyltransferase
MTPYYMFTTAFGHVAVQFQADPPLLKRVFLPHFQEEALERRLRAAGSIEVGNPPAVLDLSKEIRSFFMGRPLAPFCSLLDLTGVTPLQRSVLYTVARIPHGEVRSYGYIASEVGHTGACRFVGSTLAKNPFPILIPCHRVVRADGSTGLFQGGRALKRRMIGLEKGKPP